MGAFSLIVVINLLNSLFVVVTKMMMDYMSPSSLESVAGAAAAMSDLAPLSCNNYSEPGRTNTLNPAVTGASVVAVKYDSGVLIAADTLGSYGSMAKLRDVSRLYQVNDQVAVGFAGDLADAQFITKIISSMVLADQSVLQQKDKDRPPVEPGGCGWLRQAEWTASVGMCEPAGLLVAGPRSGHRHGSPLRPALYQTED